MSFFVILKQEAMNSQNQKPNKTVVERENSFTSIVSGLPTSGNNSHRVEVVPLEKGGGGDFK